MIGLYLDWTGASANPPTQRRLAAALGLGTAAVGSAKEGSLVVAQSCRSAAEARAWRPTRAENGAIVLFEGHMQNRDEICRELGIGDVKPAIAYAAAYLRWGDAADLRILGEFGSLVIDSDRGFVRASRTPLLAPALHYQNDGRRLAIASVAQATFVDGDRRPEVDEQKIADSLYLNYAEEERGWFKGVRRVPIGSRCMFTNGRAATVRYYDPGTLPPVRFKRDQEYVDAADHLLAEGTRAALRGFTAPAISLSGGLDSQAVAAYALREGDGREALLGLTSVPMPGFQSRLSDRYIADESGHGAALAAMYPALRHETLASPGLFFDHKLHAMFLVAGAPPRNAANLHWLHDLYGHAKARGCDVVLHGSMGNISFSFDGSGALPSWLLRGRWLRLRREIAAQENGRRFARNLWSHAIYPYAAAARAHRSWHAGSDDWDSWCGLNPDYRRSMQVEERARDLGHDPRFRPMLSTRAWRHAALGNAMNEAGDVLRALEHLHGIQLRDPTAYRPLVELCLGMPDGQFLRHGRNRWLAHRLLAGKIPAATLSERRKGVQAADWNLRLWQQRAALRDELVLLGDNPTMAARFDVPRLVAALDGWIDPNDPGAAAKTLHLAVPRTLAAARFIRFVDGSNN